MFRPGELSASEAQRLNELDEQVTRLTRMTAAPPLAVTFQGGTPLLSANLIPRILAKITGHLSIDESDDSTTTGTSDCRYSWVEVRVFGTDASDGEGVCGAIEIEGGRKGFTNSYPAVSIANDSSVVTGTIVEMWLAPDGSHWRFTVGGGGGANTDWFDVEVELREDNCGRFHIGTSKPLACTRLYRAVQVQQETQALSGPTAVNSAGCYELVPDGRVWEGNDWVLEVNGHAIADGTRVLIRYDGTITLPTGGTLPDSITPDPDLPAGTQINVWLAYYNERDPTCFMRVMHKLDGDGGCRQCFGFLAISGSFYATDVDNVPCVKGAVCRDLASDTSDDHICVRTTAEDG